MHGFRSFAFLVCIFTFRLPALHAAPTQWAGNSHYYELVSPANGISWTAANAAASGSSFNGLSGHLATFSSLEEFTFVRTTFPTVFTWIGLSDSEVENQFKWVTNESLNFTAWLPNEPNNAATPNGEDFVWYEERDGQWGWNDYQNLSQTVGFNAPMSYMIEYENVPEPQLSLLGFGWSAYLMVRRRHVRRI